jgi:hypothetical protein
LIRSKKKIRTTRELEYLFFCRAKREIARFGLIWFSGFREEDLNVIFYPNMPNLHNRYKSAERKISQKNPEYMLNYSFIISQFLGLIENNSLD